MLQESCLADIDLSPFCQVGIKHLAPSVVDYRSIVRSARAPGIQRFLREAGMPEVLIEYTVARAQSLEPSQISSLMQSTFISYGRPDEPFAEKLNTALKRAGVMTFFFPDDALPGQKLHREMRRGINNNDRVILVCSRSSLVRPGLLNELELVLEREARAGGEARLIPVKLDDFVLDGWNPPPGREDLAEAVRSRAIVDFRNHEDEGLFQQQLGKLVAALAKHA